MTSSAKLEANRRNSRKSTGPRSERGKAHSKRNAVTHGIFARRLLPGENPAVYAELEEQLDRELSPIGLIECFVADQIKGLKVRLYRVESAYQQFLEDVQHDRYLAFRGGLRGEELAL